MSKVSSPVPAGTSQSRFARLRRRLLRPFTPTVAAVPATLGTSRRPVTALVESLESRLCPSVTVAVGHFTGHSSDDLLIKGADSGQHVVVTENGASHQTTVQVDANGDGLFNGVGDFNQTFNELFFQINVNLKKGTNNRVDYLLSSDMSAANRDVVVKLGTGANTFNFDAQGHTIGNNSLLTFAVLSKDNASQNVNLSFNTIDNSEVDTTVLLGSGAHNVKLNYNGPIENNSLVQSTIALGNGNHTVAVNLFGNVANSEVHIHTTGGDDSLGHDNVAYFVGGSVSDDSLLDLGMALRAGDDTGQILVSQTGFAALDTSHVYFTIDGGKGNDTINYGSDGTTGTIFVDGLVDALLIGSGGNDTIHTNFPSTNALDLTGTFRVEADGNNGQDLITAVLSNTLTSNGSYDVQLFGGNGNDTFALTNNDPTGGGSVLYDYFGYDIVDGGGGNDVAVLSGTGIIAKNIDG